LGKAPPGNSKLWQFLPPFKLRRPFPENRGTAKQQPISAVNTSAYLFHRALKQPATVRKRSARTTNAIERLHEEFRRRIKTQTVLPSADTAAMLFWALLASGQTNMRKVDGWKTLATKPIDQQFDFTA
jgi:transposase-like protein